MNTDTMISLALDTHDRHLRDCTHERIASQAVTSTRPSLPRTARLAAGAMLIAIGKRLQGMTETSPKPATLTIEAR